MELIIPYTRRKGQHHVLRSMAWLLANSALDKIASHTITLSPTIDGMDTSRAAVTKYKP